MIRFALIMTGALAYPAHVFAQAQPQAASQAALVGELRSPDMNVRMRGFGQLKERGGMNGAPGFVPALLTLLQEEDSAIAAAWSKPNAKAPDELYGEGYGEYYSDVFDTCLRYCERSGLLGVLVQESRTVGMRYDAIRRFRLTAIPEAGFTTSERAVMDSVLVAATTDHTSNLVRGVAVSSLAKVIHGDKTLSAADRAHLHEVLVHGLSDRAPDVRQYTIEALGDLGDRGDAVLLGRIAQSDTTTSLKNGTVIFPLREEALRAIAKLPPS